MKRILFYVVLLIIVYIVVGAIAPFIYQPKIREETKSEVDCINFQSESISEERAMILSDNGEALEERIRLITQAKERIILSTFEFRTDESGKDMLAALQAAAQRGVTVQILTDGMAALTKMTRNEYFVALSAMENVQIRVYNPVSLLTPWKLMGRMHDKYLIVDDSSYILGGRNTYDYFLGSHNGYKNYDWDVLVYNNGTECGASMEQLSSYFEQVWNLSLCKTYHDDVRELDKEKVAFASNELEERYKNLYEEHPTWFEECNYFEKTKQVNHIELITNPVHCYAKEPVVFYTLTELMKSADNEVRFHTPYIVCNGWMLKRLKEVCDRAPNVVMMTNSVANNGNPFGAMDYGKFKGRILETGVRILEYDGGISYHGKCFVVDERLSGIGSFNWDMRSAYIDTEMMLVIDSREINSDLRSRMQGYEAEALTVLDEKTYLQNGLEPQKISVKRKMRILLLRTFLGWTRFLM